MIISESCIELYKFSGDETSKSAQCMAHEIIGDLNNVMTVFYDWNLLLDEKGGPNHVKNYCLVPFLHDTVNEKLMPQLLGQYLEYFSHFPVSGSVRIGYSKYTERIDMTVYKRPDGNIVVIMLNKGADAPVCMRIKGQQAEMILYPKSISTGIIRGE